MINLTDENAAEKIIELERRLGMPKDKVGEEWEIQVSDDIANLRAGFKQGVSLAALSPDGIYGQGGWNKYKTKKNGEIVFMKDFCTHMDKEQAAQIAHELGFNVQ